MSECRHNAPNRGPAGGDVQTQWHQLDEETREKRLDELIDRLYDFVEEPDLDAIDRDLAELEAAGMEFQDFDVEQGWQNFRARYGDALNFVEQEVERPTRRRRPLARIAIIAAALLCLSMVTAQASGLDIIGAIARWTSEQFSLVKVGDEKGEQQEFLFRSLQDSLDLYFVSEDLIPKEYPEGTEFVDIKVKEWNNGLLISGTYLLDEQRFYISICSVDGAPHMEVEINDPNVEVYVADGVEHYIMTDVKQRKATWYVGNWEARIVGDLSRSDMLLMIDSIYKR